MKKIAVFENGSGFGGANFSLLENIHNLSNYEFIVIHSLFDPRFLQFSNLNNCSIIYNRNYSFRVKLKSIDFIFKRFNIYLCLRVINTVRILLTLNADIIYTNNDLECNLHGIIVARILGHKVISHERDTPFLWSKVTKLCFNFVSKLIVVSEATRQAVIELGFPEKNN